MQTDGRSHSFRLILPIFVIFSLAACDRGEPPPRPEVARPIKMQVVGEGEGSGTLELPGSVFASQSAELSFEVGGRMQERIVEEGQNVEAGEVIARLDPRDYRAQRDGARARRDTARADYERYAEALRSNAVTEQQVSQAKGRYDVAQADFDIAQKALDDTELRAPFAGRIARRLSDDFANVRAKEPVLLLQDESSLEMRVDVAERDWARGGTDLPREEITRRINPQVEVASMRGQMFKAYVKEVSNVADEVTRTFRVTFGFEPGENSAVSPGMTGRVVIEAYSQRQEGLVDLRIPAVAVVADNQGSPFVWIINESTMRAEQRPVEMGELHGNLVTIRNGLEQGERIATAGVNTLTDGMLVREMDNF